MAWLSRPFVFVEDGLEQNQAVQLIVGLGNPGPDYVSTRHNAGFWFADSLADDRRERFSMDGKFHGETCRVHLSVGTCWLLKPAVFMNRSGQSVAALAAYYKIAPENILVVHDELDLEPGQVRLKRGGGHAGHNGLRDIMNALSSPDFLRLRIGIGHPGSKQKVVGYVLGRPAKQDEQLIHEAINVALTTVDDLAAGQLDKVMRLLHSS